MADPVGGHRGGQELLAGLTAHTTVLAWGARVPGNREEEALALFARHFPHKALWCLGRTPAGHPRHPLYVRQSQSLERWENAG